MVFTMKAKASIVRMAMRPARRQAENDDRFTMKAKASIVRIAIEPVAG